MKKLKVFCLFSLLILSFAMVLTSCKEKTDAKILRISYVMSPGGASHEGATKFKELVEEYTNGKIQVRLYPNGQLGSERDIIEGLKLNASDFVIVGASMVGNYAPQFAYLEFPFLFDSYEQMDKFMAGKNGQEIENYLYEKQGIKLLTYFHRGPRYLTTTKKKITTPSDLGGIKLRVPELPIYIDAWTCYGASPTPISFVDMFMALKQGVVDGQENPLEVIYTNHLYETQKYVMETEHMFGFYIVACGKKFYEKFTAEEEAILMKALDEATDYQNNLVEQYEEFYKKSLKENGMEFVKVDRNAFEQLTYEKLFPKYEKKFKLMERVNSMNE